MRIIAYDEKYRDDMIFMVLEAKDALGRVPGLNADLLTVRQSYPEAGGMFWLALDEKDRVVGCAGCRPEGEGTGVFLHRLYVKAGCKRRGIGSALLKAAEAWAAGQGKKEMYVHLGAPKEQWFESWAFYPKHGYREYREGYMKKELTAWDPEDREPPAGETGLSGGVRIQSERLGAEEYIGFLARTDLGSQYPAERFPERIGRLLQSASISLTARDESGRLNGVLLGLTDFAYWLFVTDLGVARDHERHGIGRRLMRAALDIAGGEKDIAVYLVANERAVPFYEKLGMEKAEDVMRYSRVEWTPFTVK